MKTSNISNNMMSNDKMIIGEEHRNRELHGHYRHPTPTIHTPRLSMPKIHSGNSIY
jgi:hypothetical protein